jgi:hypothetical protein
MNTTDLQLLRNFAATSRSRSGFGIPYLKLSGDDGKWTAGKNATDMDGRRLVADVPDTMTGHQKFEGGRKPVYAVVRVLDGVAPPSRDELDERDESRWLNGKDPWQPVTLVPVFDPESREPFLFTTTTSGGHDAVASLITAYTDHCEEHSDRNELPLVELNSDSYLNTHGKRIHFPIFEILSWVERPAAVLRIKPPPLTTLMLEAKAVDSMIKPATPETEFGAPTQPREAAVKAKPKRSIKADMDDEIPF